MEHLRPDLNASFQPVRGSYDKVEGCSFQSYPLNRGWELDPSTGRLTPNAERKTHKLGDLLRSWLYYGLIAAVIYDDCKIVYPFGEFDEQKFLKDRKLYTGNLPKILEDWEDWEVAQKGTAEQKMRMIRAQLALDLARTVIIKHCSLENLRLQGRVKDFMQVDKNLALILMVLGETLTNAKARIIDQIGFDVRGWYGDATIGWGTPKAVIDEMGDKGWCPRTQELLKTQLWHNATALLSAYLAHSDKIFRGHEDCKPNITCKVTSEHPLHNGKYATKHHPECLHAASQDSAGCSPFGKCLATSTSSSLSFTETYEKDTDAPTCWRPCHEMVQPDMDEVLSIIEQDKIPLFRFKNRKRESDGRSSKDTIQLEVTDNIRSPAYATISHVWSDGYGNKEENRLYRCQLDYFWRLLRQAEESRTTRRQGMANIEAEPLPFWLDTLAIPVAKTERHEKAEEKAIHQIYHVFSKAKYTIVVDNGLNSMSWDYDNYTTTAMRILASGWMRRLWTLQEAYLSRKLLFAFKSYSDEGDSELPLIDLDDIEDVFDSTSTNLVSNIPATARRYYDNLLGPDRKARIHNLKSTDGAGLIASVWQAAQWRTTEHLEHETLALATLLNLDFRKKSFSSTKILKGMSEEEQEKIRMEMMRDFWLLLEENSPGAIPPGMIFLPGPRIRLPGFGWAPVSWMLALGMNQLNSIALVSKVAELHPEKGGLLVEYPGFLLHCEDRNAIVGSTDGEGFWFPSDNSLSEWYHVTWIEDEKPYSVKIGIVHKERSENLALILSKPRPGQFTEIGLLVEVHDIKERRELGKDHKERVFVVYMLRRVHIKRETAEGTVKQKKRELIESRDSRIVCGEMLDESQKWYVDCRNKDESDILGKPPALQIDTPSNPRTVPYKTFGVGDYEHRSGFEDETSRTTTENSPQESIPPGDIAASTEPTSKTDPENSKQMNGNGAASTTEDEHAGPSMPPPRRSRTNLGFSRESMLALFGGIRRTNTSPRPH